MKYLFLDTNVLLNFYRLSSETIEELEKLVAAIEKKEIFLAINEQLTDEFWRQRENVIADALGSFSGKKLPTKFPMIIRNHDDFEELETKTKELQKLTEKIIGDTTTQAREETTNADKLIHKLFKKATLAKIDPNLLNDARARVERGNPPGKRNSIGDAIHWEILLKSIPYEENLYIVTSDLDFYSKLEPSKIDNFLEDEWYEKKNADIFLYNSLSKFFVEQYPNIKLAEDFEKEGYISQLVNSGSFQMTHAAIASLNKFDSFSDNQVKRMIEAAIENNQINWINTDSDVNAFYTNLHNKYKDKIDQNLQAVFEYHFLEIQNKQADDDDDDDEIPF